jgi:hypothetical protein
MMHQWFNMTDAGVHGFRAFALARHFPLREGEIEPRGEVLAEVQRASLGCWIWRATVDMRRPDEFGTEPTMLLAMERAVTELMKPVRV